MYTITKDPHIETKGVSNQDTVMYHIQSGLTALNNEQSELLAIIETKLHDLFDMRAGQKEKTATDSQVPVIDYAQRIRMELDRTGQNTNRLHKIIDHLNQIV